MQYRVCIKVWCDLQNLDGHISSWSLALFYPCEKNCIMQGAIPEVPLQLAKPPTPYAGTMLGYGPSYTSKDAEVLSRTGH